MKRFITAGAGSGKTYRITTEVARRVKEEGLRPEQVIMTTFTKAAAQELREKAKKELANLGLFKEVQQMEHALIGTVHSVANTFLTKYWYLLGITPDAAALEEDELQMFRDESLRGLLEKEDRKFLYQYCERYEIPYSQETKSGLNYEFWKADLCNVLNYIQWYSITDTQLDKSLNETTESIVKLLEPREEINLSNPPESLKATFHLISETVYNAKKSGMKERHQKLLLGIDLENLSIDSIKQLVDIIKDRKIEESCKEFVEWSNELLNITQDKANDHRKYAEIIFRLAKKWQRLYRTFKDEHHLIDFNDMEEMFLRLLDMEVVQQDIKSRFSCLYVDEFQDSNPMQVRIFQKLSTLIDACYVGDKKQAIYGFRGSDTELTTAVADSIEDKSTLPHSYRSVEPLVNLSNTIFSHIFKGMKDVTLTMPEDDKGNRDNVEHPLRLWQWDKNKDLALQIQQFILREKVDCKDIAVLSWKNNKLDALAKELRALGVPVCRENDNVKDSRTGRLVKALLTLMTTPGNLLAKAEIAYLVEDGYNLTKVIEDRLDEIQSTEQLKKDSLNEKPQNLTTLQPQNRITVKPHNLKTLQPQNLIPVISRLETLRNDVKSQSISALLETLIIELDLYSLVQQWEDAPAEETNLQVFIDLAKKYEDSATKLGLPATVAGFIDYFCNQKQKGAADNSGVRLFTYHKSKGLEWKVVIMLSLDENVNDSDKIAKECILGCHNHRSIQPTPENVNPPMSISLVRNLYASVGAKTPPVIISRLQQYQDWNIVCEKEKNERARLLYVGVTRARNILVLAANGKSNTINLNWFRSTGLENVQQTLTDEASQDVLGIGVPFSIEKLNKENLLQWQEPGNGTVFSIASDFTPLNNIRNLSPSKAGTTPHELGKTLNNQEKRINESVPHDREAYAQMGDFIHQVFCCMDDDVCKERIYQLRNDYGFTKENMPEPENLIDAWDYLVEALEKEYGPSVRRIHEMPFRHYDKEGHIVSGYIDFIWETEDAYVVVDYKTCAGSYNLVFKPESEHFAGRHGDQLDCYQRALEANGSKKVKARLIYYPITRFLVEVK